jgi:phosphoribosylglycinamide formyltransferase 2
VLATKDSVGPVEIAGVADAMTDPAIDVRVFGKPTTRVHRRMAVVTANGSVDSDVDDLRDRAKAAAAKITVRVPDRD